MEYISRRILINNSTILELKCFEFSKRSFQSSFSKIPDVNQAIPCLIGGTDQLDSNKKTRNSFLRTKIGKRRSKPIGTSLSSRTRNESNPRSLDGIGERARRKQAENRSIDRRRGGEKFSSLGIINQPLIIQPR